MSRMANRYYVGRDTKKEHAKKSNMWSVAEIADKTGLCKATIYARIKQGVEGQALLLPEQPRGRHFQTEFYPDTRAALKAFIEASGFTAVAVAKKLGVARSAVCVYTQAPSEENRPAYNPTYGVAERIEDFTNSEICVEQWGFSPEKALIQRRNK